MIKILDFLTTVCVITLGSKFVIQSINMMFDLNLRWYFLEDIPHLPVILFVLIFIFAVPSEMLKEKNEEKKKT